LSDGKAISAGNGGALILNSEDAFIAGYAYHNCGRSPGVGSILTTGAILGGNFRITEWQAAMAEAEFYELDAKLADRKDRASATMAELTNDWLTPLPVVAGGVSSHSAIIFRYDREKNNGLAIDRVIDDLCNKGYNACLPWCAMHTQPVFQTQYFKKNTGNTAGYSDIGLENSISAENELIWVVL